MMHVVFDGAAPERQIVMRHEGKIVANVRLNVDANDDQHVAPVRHGVVAEYVRGSGEEDTDSEHFPWMQVLRDPDMTGVVLVM